MRERNKKDFIFQKKWTEMKFKNETPSCRAEHAMATFNERLVIYGGTDGMDQNSGNDPFKNSKAKELWIIEPLIQGCPQWFRTPINDDKRWILPDFIKRHQMVIWKNVDRYMLLVIGGQRSFEHS